MALTPIRRVVTGNDEHGRSKVIWDGPSPGTHETNFNGRGHTDFWVWRETPPPLDGNEDAGTWDDEFPNPVGGGHLRVVHWLAQDRRIAAQRAVSSARTAWPHVGSRRRQ